MGATQKITENFYIQRFFDYWPSGQRGRINIYSWKKKLRWRHIFRENFFSSCFIGQESFILSVRLTMGTDHCWELGNTRQKEEGRECSVSFLARQVTLHLGHEDEGKSFKSAVKLFWYLVQSEGLGLCFLSNFLEQTNRSFVLQLICDEGIDLWTHKNVSHLTKHKQEQVYVGS